MKNNPLKISYEKIRLLALYHQGLIDSDFGKGKKGASSAIQHLGYIQIDTLSVVARAHHHTLWSRLSDYKDNYLNELLEKDKSIFEYWSHAASYLPMSDYRFTLPRKKEYADGRSHWFGQDKKMNRYVLNRIKADGPLQSKDFEFKRNGPGNWYEWKPAKRALEQLFMEGKLMVSKRQGFQKVYDLTERVLPDTIDTTIPNKKEYAEHLIKRAVCANGIVEEKEISYLRKGLKESVNKELKRLLKEGELMEVMDDDKTLYITSEEQLKKINKIAIGNEIHLLSPFDNVLIQRKRLQRIFDFDYQIECYVPEPKRKFGYFCLPVLYGDKFVARFDPKADRSSGVFYIKSLYFEKKFKPDEEFNTTFFSKLKQYALFTGCDKIVIEKADLKWKKEIKHFLSKK